MRTTMRALEASSFSLENIRLVEQAVPKAGRGEIVVRVRAASLNYRDLAILSGTYLPDLRMPFVPASDASGEIVEVGPDVNRFKVGDRICPIYTQGWHDGRPTPEQRFRRTLGGPLPGVLQDCIVVPAEDAVFAPSGLTHEEASTLPIAALTAWSTLRAGEMKAGDTVLLLGTGGVSLFALQFAKHAGAKVIILSSSDEKLQRALKIGADFGVNYNTQPKWDLVVKEVTGGRGADIIVETGGATLPTSLGCIAFGGFIGIVGFVGGYETTLNIRQLIGPTIRMQGIAVGSRAAFEAMNRAIEVGGLKPIIDSTFSLEQGANAFAHMKKAGHFGKVVVTL